MRVYILDMGSDSLNQMLIWLLEKKNIEEIMINRNPNQFVRKVGRELPDLVFIRLGDYRFSGLAIGKMVKNIDPNIKLVFIADEGDCALDAYEIGADGYLLCPVKKEKLDKLNVF